MFLRRFFGHLRIQGVMSQVLFYGDPLQASLGREDFSGREPGCNVQRQRRAQLARIQRKSTDQLARQHGDFQAGNIYRRHATAGELVEFIVAAYSHAWYGNMYAYLDGVFVYRGHRQSKIGSASCRERELSVRVDLGGRRSIKTKKRTQINQT